MKIFCFLGNIGKQYEKTRHNAGFLCGDYLQEKLDFSVWKEEKKFFGSVSEGSWEGEKSIFLKPSTFMNVSGKSLLSIMQFYKIEIEDIVVIYDDKDMQIEKVRYREKGSSGGQNGIKDIIRVLGTDEFIRVKIGVGNEKQAYFKDTADFVLSNFSADEISFLHTDVFPKVQAVIEEKVFE